MWDVRAGRQLLAQPVEPGRSCWNSGLAACRRHHVDIRVKAGIAGNAGPDLEDLRLAVRAVLETMAVAVAGSKPRCVARAQCFLTLVGHEHHFARKDIDEFVFVAMPVPLA